MSILYIKVTKCNKKIILHMVVKKRERNKIEPVKTKYNLCGRDLEKKPSDYHKYQYQLKNIPINSISGAVNTYYTLPP